MRYLASKAHTHIDFMRALHSTIVMYTDHRNGLKRPNAVALAHTCSADCPSDSCSGSSAKWAHVCMYVRYVRMLRLCCPNAVVYGQALFESNESCSMLLIKHASTHSSEHAQTHTLVMMRDASHYTRLFLSSFCRHLCVCLLVLKGSRIRLNMHHHYTTHTWTLVSLERSSRPRAPSFDIHSIDKRIELSNM